MGFPWSKIGGVLKGLLPFVPLVGGPAGAILKAIAASRFTGKARQFLDVVAPAGISAGRRPSG